MEFMEEYMRKFGLLCLALVVALGTMGVGYALWFEDLYIEGTVYTGELDWAFDCGTVTSGDPCDPPTIDKQCDDLFANIRTTGKNVGCTEVLCVDTDKDGDADTLQVTVSNAYPGYYVHIGYYVCNNGTIPLHFDRAIIGSGATEYPFYAIPCVVSFDVHVRQPADMLDTYTFFIKLTAVQYNETIVP